MIPTVVLAVSGRRRSDRRAAPPSDRELALHPDVYRHHGKRERGRGRRRARGAAAHRRRPLGSRGSPPGSCTASSGAWSSRVARRRVAVDRSGRRRGLPSSSETADACAVRSAPPRSARSCATSLSIVVWTIAVLIVLGELGVNLAPLIASAGIAGVALGFGTQSIVRDYLAGLFVVLEDQYGVGDEIDTGVGDRDGRVGEPADDPACATPTVSPGTCPTARSSGSATSRSAAVTGSTRRDAPTADVADVRPHASRRPTDDVGDRRRPKAGTRRPVTSASRVVHRRHPHLRRDPRARRRS